MKILLRQKLQFLREPHGAGKRRTGGNHAVVGEQAAVAPLQRLQRIVGKLPCSIASIGRAAHRVAAKGRDHVMDGGDVAAGDGEDGGEGGMGVDDGVDVGPGLHDVEVEPPFDRGLERALKVAVAAAERHGGDHFRAHVGIRNGAWRDEHHVLAARADVAGCALVQANGVHVAALVDDVLPQMLLFHDVLSTD